MNVITRGWRRFRALPIGAQVASWVGIAAVYTVALVVILGGGDGGGDDSSSATEGLRTLSAEEREIGELVVGSPVKGAKEQTDVPAFRKPNLRDVKCNDDVSDCSITYSIGLPGRGRIFEDQQRMLLRLFSETDLERVTLLVIRASAVGEGVPAKATEETPPGAKLLQTTCVRSDESHRADSGVQGTPAIPADCDIGSFPGGGKQARDARDQAPKSGDPGILGAGGG